jgi:hypothetical protein
MGRLRRFPDSRIIGRRDLMMAYDCDDEAQYVEISAVVTELRLDDRNLIQAFAPDTLVEARNRGFRHHHTDRLS